MSDDERLNGIGGGDIAAIVGLDKYQTPYQLWQVKTGKRVVEQTPQMRRGLLLEPYVRDLYRAETGLVTTGPQFVRADGDPWMQAHLDDLAGQSLTTLDRVSDYKTTRAELRRMWGEPGSSDVPLPIQTQMQWYMLITRKSLADVAAAFGFDDFVIFQVPFDPDAADILYEAAHKFWFDHVKADIPPPLTAIDAPRYFRKDDGSARIADDKTRRIAGLLRINREQLKVLEQVIESQEGQIKLAMAEASILKDEDGQTLATWKNSKPAERIDSNRLRAEYPDIARALTVVGEPSRRFILK